jgi:hypothetical protein
MKGGKANMKKTLSITLSLVVSLGILAGAGAIVRAEPEMVMLDYETTDKDADSCTTSVGVVAFKDERRREAIGESGRGKKIYSRTLVNEWVSRALAAELAGDGCRVDFHDRVKEADSKYTITGKVQEAYIKQDSMTKYNVHVRLHITLMSGTKKIMSKSYSGRMTTRTPPMLQFNDRVASDMLRYMMERIVPDLEQKMS